MRPKTLPAAVAPLLVAIALSVQSPYPVSLPLVILAMLCSLTLQILVNFANDYSDAKSGVDTDKRVGPTRATQSGLIAEQQMFRAICITATLAICFGLPLVIAGGVYLAVVGVLCVIAALAYSGGPFPLASNALGEITVFVFFGLVAVVGGTYLFTGLVLPHVWYMATICGLPISAIMLVNNTRDIQTDALANKNTLSVRVGRSMANRIFLALLTMPLLVALVAWLQSPALWTWPIASALTLPFALRLSRAFNAANGASFNPLLGQTSQFCLWTSILYSCAILIA
ncbi:1,4-dihydroxy-2-naphthoate octaprenyltransferase [Echinimonas agarilytica]|uniref:1,4-dihydroxy-2-naphthoate octaprenyltransferase n=1 Tax=Echinimonas agarilytica TaxID=1215918 RepID=A0AA41W8T0_9GAMM|nr:1,4-dihydroxy-2-naphthoate octaprenyltransferase [Echinimonas agarilytica]MCM2680642.1 1,4-dihydroxy-2-naphthoate octaprenyltransferase [Echinimonas agarilytica]